MYLLVVSVILCLVAAPSAANLALHNIEETRAPLETKEESQERFEEGRVNNQRRFWLSMRYRTCRVNVHQVTCFHHFIFPRPPRSIEGHRLSSGILAPLTC